MGSEIGVIVEYGLSGIAILLALYLLAKLGSHERECSAKYTRVYDKLDELVKVTSKMEGKME